MFQYFFLLAISFPLFACPPGRGVVQILAATELPDYPAAFVKAYETELAKLQQKHPHLKEIVIHPNPVNQLYEEAFTVELRGADRGEKARTPLLEYKLRPPDGLYRNSVWPI